MLALAVMSTSFTSLAIATGFERRYGVIKRLGSSPLPRSGLLAGKIGGLLLVEVLQVAVISAVAFALGWDPAAGGVPLAVLAVVLGTAAFAALGLFVAGVLRAEATLAAANLVYLLLLAGGAAAATAGGAARTSSSTAPERACGGAAVPVAARRSATRRSPSVGVRRPGADLVPRGRRLRRRVQDRGAEQGQGRSHVTRSGRGRRRCP